MPDGFDELSVARRARVRDDDAVRRRFRLAYSAQADVHGQVDGVLLSDLRSAGADMRMIIAVCLDAGHPGQPRETPGSSHRAHLLHELAHLGVLLDELIYVGDRRPGACRDPPPAGSVDQPWIGPLGFRHRRDHRLDLSHLPLGGRSFGELLREPTHAGNHLQQVSEGAHPLDLLELRVEIVERELRIEKLARLLFSGLLVDLFLGTLDEREDVPHSEDALRQAVRVEDFDRVELLAGPDELPPAANDATSSAMRAGSTARTGIPSCFPSVWS